MAQRILILFSSFLIIFLFISCNSQRRMEKAAMKNQELVDKIKEKRQAERMGDYEKALEKHYDQQTAKTKREMKRKMREAERYNYNKKEFFIVRWYKAIFIHQANKVKRKANK